MSMNRILTTLGAACLAAGAALAAAGCASTQRFDGKEGSDRDFFVMEFATYF